MTGAGWLSKTARVWAKWVLTGDAESELIGVVGKEPFEEGALPDTRGARDDEGA